MTKWMDKDHILISQEIYVKDNGVKINLLEIEQKYTP